MRKKFIFIFLTLIIYSLCAEKISADITGITGGNQANLGNLGSGQWYPEFVGLKISVVDNKNTLKDSEIFLNKRTDWLKNNAKLCTNMKPKTKYSKLPGKNSLKWKSINDMKTYVNKNLPGNWLSNDKSINMHEILNYNNYALLKQILNRKNSSGVPAFPELINGDYILVEPMVYIGGYYGTAFELLNDFAGSIGSCSSFFCYWYTGAVFGGDSSRQGVLYTTLYTPKNVKINDLTIRYAGNWVDTYLSNSNEYTWIKRNRCLKSISCGRGIGVYKYDEVFGLSSCNDKLQNLINKSLDSQNFAKQLEDLSKEYPQYNQLKNNDNPSCTNITDGGNVCEQNLSKLGANPTPKDLIQLYETLYDNGSGNQYRGLLNFSNPSCTNEVNDYEELSCMNATKGKDDMDFSNATIENIDGTNKLVCKKYFTIVGDTSDGFTNSGQLIYSNKNPIDYQKKNNDAPDENPDIEENEAYIQVDLEEATDDSVMTGTLVQMCYSPNEIVEWESKINYFSNSYEGIIQNESLAGINLQKSNLNPIFKRSDSLGGGYLYTKQTIVKYYLSDIYAVVVSGKIVNIDDPLCNFSGASKKNNACINIGKGIPTNFNNNNTKFNFSYDYDGLTQGPAECDCTPTPVIVINNKLNVEFRTINTSDPFSGKIGQNRIVGNNWCQKTEGGLVENCSGIPSENSTIETYITNKNDSYNKTNDGAKYTITLTPSIIDGIRKYNKKYPYDDINLNCENDVCISNYLTKLRDDGLLLINNSENREKIEK